MNNITQTLDSRQHYCNYAKVVEQGARAAVPAFANAHPPSKAAFAAELLGDSYVLCQAPVFLYFKHSSKLFLQVQRTGLRKTSLESTVFQILEWQASSLPFFLRYRLSLFSLTFCEQE